MQLKVTKILTKGSYESPNIDQKSQNHYITAQTWKYIIPEIEANTYHDSWRMGENTRGEKNTIAEIKRLVNPEIEIMKEMK